MNTRFFLGLVAVLSLLQTGCMTSYLLHTGYNQAKLLRSRRPISDVLQDGKISPQTRKQLELVLKVRAFAHDKLKLKVGRNYLDYVQLERPYVTWIVSAAKAWDLEQYEWSFPIVGSVPYLGFFREPLAREKAKEFNPDEFDVTVRGVSAFSTLGWFSDPVYSSMLSDDDLGLVNTIIHESVHATLYIPGDADFNEQVATFLGDWGTELYYQATDPSNKDVLQRLADENHDRLHFSKFLSEQMDLLSERYKDLKSVSDLQSKRARKRLWLGQLKDAFRKQLAPKLKTTVYAAFPDRDLNNATLLAMKTYYDDWDELNMLRTGDANLALVERLNLFALAIEALDNGKVKKDKTK